MTLALGSVSVDDVLDFWFGPPGAPPLANAARWYKKDLELDGQIRERFQETLERAAHGELPEWKKTPRGRLALVILFDQLSRNMFRDTPRAFAQDGLAVQVSSDAFAAGDDQILPAQFVQFLLMPYMHAEDPALQQRCIDGFAKLAETAPDELKQSMEGALGYAKQHAKIVAEFGRFPHRNKILGRESTPEETEFLTQPNSSF